MRRTSVLLIANYRADRQQSMLRYASWLSGTLIALGFAVYRIEPEPYLGRYIRERATLNKWLAYVDKFIIFPVKLRKIARNYDIVHIADNGNAPYRSFTRGVPTIVTCHDLLALKSSRGETESGKVGQTGRIFQRWILHSLKKIKYVCCISQTTADDFSRLAGTRGKHIRLIPQVLNYPYGKMQKDAARRILDRVNLRSAPPFFLHVGGNTWYKNRMGVVTLFAELRRRSVFKNFALVLAGAELPLAIRQRIAAPDLAGSVHKITEPSSETMRALYSSAEAFLFPSLQEGFGWPILEAQACGCPVITSDREPMKTVGGTAALFIDPADVPGSGRLIEQNWEWIQSQRENSLRNLDRYSQQEAGARYLTLYQAALSQAMSGRESLEAGAVVGPT